MGSPRQSAPIRVEELADAGPAAALLLADRTVALGPAARLAFESRATLLARLRELVLNEGISDPEALQAECDVYSALLPGAALTATLALQPPPGVTAGAFLQGLAGLAERLWLDLGAARVQAALSGPELSLSQFVRFPMEEPARRALAANEAATLVLDHPNYRHSASLPAGLRRALLEELS